MKILRIDTPTISGIIFILVGVIIWFIGNSTVIVDYPNLSTFSSDLGLTLIGLGIITILVDLPDWRNYFGERLKEIVLERKYLDNLSDRELMAVQRNILKSRYKESGIDKEGSFLNFMQGSIEHLINSPYREHIASNCNIIDQGDGLLYYKEKMSYTLKSVGANKINKVQWIWRKDEIIETKKFKCILKCPKYKEKMVNCSCPDGQKCENGFKTITKAELIKINDVEVGYIIDIKEFMEPIDGIQVFIELEFTMSENNLYSWTMADLSKDINIALIYPPNYEVDRYIGGLSDSDYYISTDFHENTIYFVREGWMLPTSGITFSLSKKNQYTKDNVKQSVSLS